MHLSMVCPRIGGGATLGEFDIFRSVFTGQFPHSWVSINGVKFLVRNVAALAKLNVVDVKIPTQVELYEVKLLWLPAPPPPPPSGANH